MRWPGYRRIRFVPQRAEISEAEAAEFGERLRQSLSQGTPAPASLPRHTYGAGGTIHQTGTIDIQVGKDGEIKAVWFRCRTLPFTVSVMPDTQEALNPAGEIVIEGITYVVLNEGNPQ